MLVLVMAFRQRSFLLLLPDDFRLPHGPRRDFLFFLEVDLEIDGDEGSEGGEGGKSFESLECEE